MPDARLAGNSAVRKVETSSYMRMMYARRAFFDAWSSWLRDNPSDTELELEQDGTTSVLRQLADLLREQKGSGQ